MIYSVSLDKAGYKVTTVLGMKLKKKITPVEYWQERAKKYGKRSVYNMGYGNNELDEVDRKQEEIYKRVLEKELNRQEKTALDFGCGAGRFESMLAKLVRDKVYAFDPIGDLINIAPLYEKVQYEILKGKQLPLNDKSIDLVFISQVLDGVVDECDLNYIASELERVSSDNALFFIVENISNVECNGYWKYRMPEEYMRLFNFVDLVLKEVYLELGEEIGVMVGRKKSHKK